MTKFHNLRTFGEIFWAKKVAVQHTAVNEPSVKYFQLSCLHGRRWRKRRKIGMWIEVHQILPVLEVWRR